MTESSSAVFLSYASQDLVAARRIGAALIAGGIEVWFDQSELRGGDAWDQLIRRQIRDCALFIPVISATTSARDEGYFRLEWTLADQRSQMIARNRAFIVPVCLDETPATGADVPESFQRVQWTRLPGGETPRTFVDRVASLVRAPAAPPGGGSPVADAGRVATAPSIPPTHPPLPAVTRRRGLYAALGLVAVVALGAFATWSVRQRGPSTPSAAMLAAADKSIAVMPFEDLSEGHDQAYFADGLAEEVLDLLAQVPNLRVPARSSSFYFRGRNEKLAVIARELRVAHVLEGTVRRAGSTIRVSVQLVRADTGYHVWSSIYDRDVKDVFKVQDEISAAVVGALQARLATAGVAAAHRTNVPEAYDEYLAARYLYHQGGQENWAKSIAHLRRTMELDPRFAQAYSLFAVARYLAAADAPQGDAAGVREALVAADQAVALAPDLAESFSARAFLRVSMFDVAGAEQDIRRALELDPNDAAVNRRSGFIQLARGDITSAIAALRHAVELDPLDANSLDGLAGALRNAGNFDEALASERRLQVLAPLFNDDFPAVIGDVLIHQGHLTEARAECSRSVTRAGRLCLAVLDGKEGQRARALASLQAIGTEAGLPWADQLASAYAEIGEPDPAFIWLERAARARMRSLNQLLITREWQPYRSDPRFIAVLRELHLRD